MLCKSLALAGVAFLALFSGSSHATLINLTASLDGAQEVPQVAPFQALLGGSGSAVMTYDDVENILSWTITYSVNTGPATAAHFHSPAPPGVAAAVRFPIPGIAGTSSGAVIGSFDLDNLGTPDVDEQNLLSGLFYINIHTSVFPSGEIRGQVLVVPEPATWLLLGAGFALLAARRRERRWHQSDRHVA